jgi:hypothetical protein
MAAARSGSHRRDRQRRARIPPTHRRRQRRHRHRRARACRTTITSTASVTARRSPRRFARKAPDADIFAIKVFDRELAATGKALVAACEYALTLPAQIVNLSLGTQNPEHEPALTGVVKRLRESGAIVIAAGEQDGIRWLPGSIAGVWAVTLDWSVPRDTCRLDRLGQKGASFRATGFPRPIPGLPPEKNLKGLSFAVANVTGNHREGDRGRPGGRCRRGRHASIRERVFRLITPQRDERIEARRAARRQEARNAGDDQEQQRDAADRDRIAGAVLNQQLCPREQRADTEGAANPSVKPMPS